MTQNIIILHYVHKQDIDLPFCHSVARSCHRVSIAIKTDSIAVITLLSDPQWRGLNAGTLLI